MEFDGIDINMGCPVAKVVKRGECSGLIGTLELAKEIILVANETLTNFRILRRYYSIYTKGFPGAVELRARLMETRSINDV